MYKTTDIRLRKMPRKNFPRFLSSPHGKWKGLGEKIEVSVRLIALHRRSLRHPEFGKTVSVRLTVFHIRLRNEAALWNGYQFRRCALSKT